MKILVGMSGGLDSTYTVNLLRNLGHEVEGAILKMHEYTEISSAIEAAEFLNVKLHIIDAQKEFDNEVKNYFIKEYTSGRTPNPCTICNRHVKFKILCDFAKENGFDKVSTGHYAKIGYENGKYFVKKGLDPKKDQSYMLWNLSQDELSMLYFPIGELIKEEIREKARDIGIKAADKDESQDICFIPDGDYASFIENIVGKSKEGNFVLSNGKVVGKHKGIIHYTVGQRKGLGIALGQKMFVSSINPIKNEITLSPATNENCDSFYIDYVNYQCITEFEAPNLLLNVKARYSSKTVPCNIKNTENGVLVCPLEPIKTVTPGQSAVFYIDDKIALGGIIRSF